MAEIHVSTFAELAAAISQTGNTVILDNDIDFNDEYPEGYTGSFISINSDLDGSGHMIKNLTSERDVFGSGSATISNVNFADMYVMTGGRIFMCNPTFKDCTFSGILQGGQLFGDSRSSPSFEHCGLNFRHNGGTFMSGNWNSYAVLKNCHFKITGYKAVSKLALQNSLLEGEFSSLSLGGSYGKMQASVINADVTGDVTNGSYQSDTNSVLVNSDRVGGTIGNYLTAVTSEQLHDAEYLASIGFPIGVD